MVEISFDYQSTLSCKLGLNQMTRDKLYFAYLFINILWMVISLAVKQANIKIELPTEWELPEACFEGKLFIITIGVPN